MLDATRTGLMPASVIATRLLRAPLEHNHGYAQSLQRACGLHLNQRRITDGGPNGFDANGVRVIQLR